MPSSDSDPAGADPAVPSAVARRQASHAESARANRGWWDREAASYQRENAAILGDRRLMWGPEGIYEDDLGLLGDIAGTRILEFGSGAGQGAMWCADQGASVIAVDLSIAMLRYGRTLDRAIDSALTSNESQKRPGEPVNYIQADVLSIPLADDTVDVAYSAFGALPFVPDVGAALAEVARVLRPGGRLVFAVSHPFRWSLPDAPGEAGLRITHSYFDRRAYVEEDADGLALYTEHHHTFGDWVAAISGAGLHLAQVVEPEWPAAATHTWGGWDPHRGRLIPGTAVFVTRKGSGYEFA